MVKIAMVLAEHCRGHVLASLLFDLNFVALGSDDEFTGFSTITLQRPSAISSSMDAVNIETTHQLQDNLLVCGSTPSGP